MVSVFDLFKIGIGPSSSHTVGPMVAANQFVQRLQQQHSLDQLCQIDVDLYGSLAATGQGHATDTAILLGLLGHQPHSIDSQRISAYLTPIYEQQQMQVAADHSIDFDPARHIHWHPDSVMPHHPNALSLTAQFTDGSHDSQTYYSIGGGFVLNADDIHGHDTTIINNDSNQIPYPFTTAAHLLSQCREHAMSISELVYANECNQRSAAQIDQHLDTVWAVMQDCVKQGCQAQGQLPGGLKVKRRAKHLYEQLCSEYQQAHASQDPLLAMDWVDLYALAVNEQNASGGKVVTAPTNGAAGIIPAVLHYYRDFVQHFNQQGVRDFLLVATAIGSLFKQNASISGAEVGCQGEVGSACAMAAAGLAHVLGASPSQCLNAAEIGIEHNLGLTCDPIAGLVQVPCIERNAMAAVKAINAARLARRGDGEHFVSLDKAIATMKQTGADMSDKYKETARGGLAVFADDRIPTVKLGDTAAVSVNYSQC